MVLPPPNVTGSLHIGHALAISIEDAIIRWRRMKGDNVIWIPGLDHASISTQVVVEKKLKRELGLTRHDIGREEFLKHVWEWKNTYGNRIVNQLKRTGASLDWTKQVFTMDEKLSYAVNESFIRLFEEGLIYRKTRLVNWCCYLQTVISDIEVDFIELEKRTFIKMPNSIKQEMGVIYYVKYPVKSGVDAMEEHLTVATTRPETMLGDVALAVHPDDLRYKKFHGKQVVHPLTKREIPIICDPTLVDPSFGTGVVKVTPAHDYRDYECGIKYELPLLNIFELDGTINENGLKWKGLNRFHARDSIIEELVENGFFLKKEDHHMRVAVCSRSGDILEPLLYPQWYLCTQKMAKNAISLVKDGKIKIIPQHYKEEWFRWLENIHDWCISRQLWWGHRIPAYKVLRKNSCSKEYEWVVAHTESEAREKVIQKLGLSNEDFVLHQDSDVLDTWFSSSLFPLSSLGWPHCTEDLKNFYPLSIMETGSDILFFWVARMVMMCSHFSENIPFKTIYLHPLVRDAKGRKMSKSIGNVIDPIDVIEGKSLFELQRDILKSNISDREELLRAEEALKKDFPEGIPECGTDALRFTLAAYTLQGRNINLDVNRIASNRRFCNKIWNATLFVLNNLGGERPDIQFLKDESLTCLDRWILHRLAIAIQRCNEGFEKCAFSEGTSAIHSFLLYDLCDIYIEFSKFRLYKRYDSLSEDQYNDHISNTRVILLVCLETSFRLMHPFMPFLSEELWQRLPLESKPESIMVASYPSHEFSRWIDLEINDKMENALNVIHSIRSIRQQYGVLQLELNFKVAVCESLFDFFNEIKETLKLFCKGKSFEICFQDSPNDTNSWITRILSSSCKLYVEVPAFSVEEECKKLKKKIEKLQGNLTKKKQKMKQENYTSKVPLHIQEKDKMKLQETQTLLEEAICKLKELQQNHHS